jgi:hypothetical protein
MPPLANGRNDFVDEHCTDILGIVDWNRRSHDVQAEPTQTKIA